MVTQVLLLHDQEEPLAKLRLALANQSIGAIRARSCAEALRILSYHNSPQIIFTDLTVTDGSWADVLRLASRTRRPVDLIVVSELVDIPLYIAAMESGAFDFMVPPFADDDVAYVLGRAADDVARRSTARMSLAMSA